MTNRVLPLRCIHLERGELKHVHTLELSTTELADADYRHRTGPDTMELCPLCTGQVHAALLMAPAAGVPTELDVALLIAAHHWLKSSSHRRGDLEAAVLANALERWLEQKSALDPNKRLP